MLNTSSQKTNDTPESEVSSQPTAPLPEVLTVDEVAALLRVNRKTVYEAIKRKQIPGARHIGATIRISRAAVLAWLGGQECAPAPVKGGAR